MKTIVAALGAIPAACTLGLAILAGGQSATANPPDIALAMCHTSGPVRDLDPVQAQNARVIVAATQLTVANSGGDQDTQARADLIALMTADAESSLHNYANPRVPASEQLPNDGDPMTGGDHDSVGLFQQRENWGPLSARMNPAESTRLFIDRLMQVPSWQIQPPGVVAQLVQVSAFPDRYAQHETQARAWLGQIAGTAALPQSHRRPGRPRQWPAAVQTTSPTPALDTYRQAPFLAVMRSPRLPPTLNGSPSPSRWRNSANHTYSAPPDQTPTTAPA